LSDLDIDDLLLKATNKFLLSNAASGRAKQIVEGSLPYVNHFDPNNAVITALREIAADKIRIKVLSAPTKKATQLLGAEKDKKKNGSVLDRLAKGKKSRENKVEKKKKK